MVRADNVDINTIKDIKGRIVEASSILLMGSGQTQWQEMRKHGLDLLVDPAQARIPARATAKATKPAADNLFADDFCWI